jgi:hypothetical protein
MSNEHVWEWAYLTAMAITDYITQKNCSVNNIYFTYNDTKIQRVGELK